MMERSHGHITYPQIASTRSNKAIIHSDDDASDQGDGDHPLGSRPAAGSRGRGGASESAGPAVWLAEVERRDHERSELIGGWTQEVGLRGGPGNSPATSYLSST